MKDYAYGYFKRESERLEDQAETLWEIFPHDIDSGLINHGQ